MSVKSISLKNSSGIEISEENEILLERVARIIMTNPFERVNNPLFGSLTENFLFQLPNALVQNIELHLKQRIEYFEPRLIVESSSLKISKEVVDITINMIKRENFEPLTFEASIGL